MSHPRLFVADRVTNGTDVELQGDRAKYVGRVLRLRPNDPISLFDGSGDEFRGVIRSMGKNVVSIAVTDVVSVDVESPLSIHLLQGLSRGERMDFVVQKATELGVSRITPVLTEYSVVKLDAKRASKRHAHWHGIAVSACEQSGRTRLPEVDPPIGLRQWLDQNRNEARQRIILRPGAATRFETLALVQSPIVLIGPEGGFSDDEYDLAEATGFQALGLGPRVLRTETAALAVLAALQTLHGDLG